MDYFDSNKIQSVIITFENMQQLEIDGALITRLGIENTKMLNNGEHVPYPTCISIDKEIYRSPDVLERLRQYHDIAWIDVIFKNKLECTWAVPWEDHVSSEYENALQHNNEWAGGLSIYIEDYKLFV